MRRFAVILGLSSLGALGCHTTERFSNPDPETEAVGTDGAGGLFDTDRSCCIDLGAFEGLSLFTEAAAPCPSGAVPGFTARADLDVEPHTCACACLPPSCALPVGMHTHSAKCANLDNSQAFPFGPLADWDGACSNQSALPAGLQCDGGLPCVQSLTVPAVEVVPCKPFGPVPSLPDAKWGRTIRECKANSPPNTCQSGQVCVPAVPEGFRPCFYAEGVHMCPGGYDDQAIFYKGIKDDRSCGECSCEAPQGTRCVASVSVYMDGACSSPDVTVLVSTGGEVCVDLISGSALGSTEGSFVADAVGSCAQAGGVASGTLEPIEAVTLCCAREVLPPG